MVVLATGCGRIAFEPFTAPTDSTSDGAVDSATVCNDPIADAFDDGVISSIWSVSVEAPVTVVEANGNITITLAETGNLYGNLTIGCRYDMRGREISIEVLDVPDGDPAAEMFLELGIDGDNRVGIDVTSSNLRSYRRIGGNYVDVDVVPYDALAKRFWRLRETAGTMFSETSDNRVDWTVRHSEASPLDVSNVEIGIHAGTFDVATSPGVARFDNFDVR